MPVLDQPMGLSETVCDCTVGRLGLRRSLVLLVDGPCTALGGIAVDVVRVTEISPDRLSTAFADAQARLVLLQQSPDAFAIALHPTDDAFEVILPRHTAPSTYERSVARRAFGLPERRTAGERT